MPEQSPHKLIRNGQLEDNIWRLHQPVDDQSLPPDEAGWMITLAAWKSQAKRPPERQHPLGIVMPTDADCGDLVLDAGALQQRPDVAFIAVHFPHYGDGRGFSLAWILREEYGWKGELRALGDVLIDTIYYLSRCGFDSFLVKPGHDPLIALQALNTFTGHYQQG